ncbi:MAG: hypothetical protein EPO21_15010 [Chloroflexota bacterium]|nr:MAG: hypothetical protein EPO21_15010 [Chloroflexota bacterium]
MNFFCSVEHLEEWRSQNEKQAGQPVSVAEAAELGRRWWRWAARNRDEREMGGQIA